MCVWEGGGGGGGGRGRLRLLRHLSILLFEAREPKKRDRQKRISLEWPFHKLFKIQLSGTLGVLVKVYPD